MPIRPATRRTGSGWPDAAPAVADAAPYFRVFNPVLQGQKFDPEGIYVRRFVPELSAMPSRYIHRPWEAPDSVLKDSRVNLGETYPRPIVDLKASRDRALAAYEAIKDGD